MPKEVFGDRVGNSNTLVVKWGIWGTIEIATESNKEFDYPFATGEELPEKMRGWYLSLSKEELKRLIKVLQKAYRQYDMDTIERG